jgi:hypothetical protein
MESFPLVFVLFTEAFSEAQERAARTMGLHKSDSVLGNKHASLMDESQCAGEKKICCRQLFVIRPLEVGYYVHGNDEIRNQKFFDPIGKRPQPRSLEMEHADAVLVESKFHRLKDPLRESFRAAVSALKHPNG